MKKPRGWAQLDAPPPEEKKEVKPKDPDTHGARALEGELRKVQKKLNDVEKLKAAQAAGETLEKLQLQKVEKEGELMEQLHALGEKHAAAVEAEHLAGIAADEQMQQAQ